MSTNPTVHNEFDTTEVKSPKLYTELEKDALHMNVDVIKQELAADYPDNPDAACAQMLNRIARTAQAPRTPARRVRTWAAWAAAIVVCALVFSAVTVTVARSVGGDSVLQFFSSLLGLSSFRSSMVDDHSVTREASEGAETEGVWDRSDENEMVIFASQDELLAAVPYYQEGLRRVFERYPFVTAYQNTDSLMTDWVITLSAESPNPIYINLIARKDGESTFFSYEENMDEQEIVWIGDIQLSCVQNYDSSSVTWADSPIHCCVWSYEPMDMLVAIAQQLITN